MDDEPEQGALFEIEGPDERGCVWLVRIGTQHRETINLGPADKVAEVMSQWLGSIDYDEAT